MKALCNFWVGCYLNEFKTSCITSHKHYNNISCILGVCLLCTMLCAGRFGLGWAHDEGLSISPFRPRTFFIPRHLLFLLILTPHPLTSDSAIRRLKRTSLRTFHDVAFIQNAKSFFQIFLTLTCPLSSTVRVRSHYVVPRSHAIPWSYKSSTPICTDLTTLYPSLSLTFELYAW